MESIKEETEKFDLAMKWIQEHREEFLYQWVCLDGNELISHGKSAVNVHNEAKAKGIKTPFVERIVKEQKRFSDSWEMSK